MIASVKIREMFDGVAPGYDRANQILSLGIHRLWRRRLVSAAGVRPGDRILDCATGTGDLAFELEKTARPLGSVTGIDFSSPMISIARQKSQVLGSMVEFVVGDVLSLPFPDAHFDAATIAFGIRNVDDPAAGLREMARVVRPGGSVAVLEFGQPDNAVTGRLYRWYSDRVLPKVGGWITGQPSSYLYLSDSAATFPAGQKFASLMHETNAFSAVSITPLTMKIVYLYVGTVG